MLRSTRSIPFRRLAVAAALSIACVGTVSAADLFGGGATFPAQAYVGSDYNLTTPDSRLSTNAGNSAGAGFQQAGLAAGSVFGKYSADSSHRVSYCQTGSGTGKRALIGTVNATGTCRDFSASPAGLSAASAAPSYIGTDSPITQADYDAFLAGSNAGRTALIQVPSIGGAIALPINDNVSNPAGNSIALSTAQVCSIFSGQTTQWSDISAALSGPITVAYRSDDSGTTFAFTSFLTARCNGTANVPTGFTFKPDQNFVAAVTQGTTFPAYAASVAASGNANVVSTVETTNEAIGYADVAEVVAQGVLYATVDGMDPVSLPASVSISSADLLQGQVINGSSTAPLVAPSLTTAQKNCLRLIRPGAAISNAYPILAITYLAGYHAGNGLDVAALKGLYNAFLLPTDGSTRAVLPAGYTYLDGSATYRTLLRNTINNCVL